MGTPRFITSKRYTNSKGQKFGKGVWVDDKGSLIKPGQGFYNSDTGQVIQYNSDGTTTKYSRQDFAKKSMMDHQFRVLQNDRKYAIPTGDNQIVISLDKGTPTDRLRGARISRNLLDSVKVNTEKTNTIFDTNLGIAAKESTLGADPSRKPGISPVSYLELINNPFDKDNPYVKKAREISYEGLQSPTLLVSNWQQGMQHPFAPFFYDGVNLLTTPRDNSYYDKHFEDALKAANKYKFEEVSPLYDAFRLGVNKYNRGDKQYPVNVERRVKEIKHSPELRQYKKEEGIKATGGFLQPQDAWDTLSLREKAAMIKVAVNNGIYDLQAIRSKYNEFAEGGDTVGEFVNALYENNPREEYLGEPSHNYDLTQSEEWANEHGYYPDARGHRDDRVKKPSHPSHPSRGTWNDNKFELTDLGMQNPNYTLFGLTDGGQDPQAVLTYQGGIVLPEVTVTPNENYFYNPYDNIILHQKANGGKIHIKPENRGKFTALKKRTGHSASWFKKHGTPAQKKMAVFALNARKWKHGEGGPLVDWTMRNIYGDGGETTAFTPIAKPIIPKVEGDQEAVNWIANWYNNRREQLYNNLNDYDGRQVFLYNMKDRLTGTPIGRRAINHDYYNKLNNMAQYKPSTFDDLERDNTASYDMLIDTTAGYTVPEIGKIYYNDELIDFLNSNVSRQEGFTPRGVHVHERVHSSGDVGNDGYVGYNAQTNALGKIIKRKDGVEYDERWDTMPEIYARMMEFRYNHGLNPKKKYSKEEIQKLLDLEKKKLYRSELQRYDIEALTKALNEVAQVNKPKHYSYTGLDIT